INLKNSKRGKILLLSILLILLLNFVSALCVDNQTCTIPELLNENPELTYEKYPDQANEYIENNRKILEDSNIAEYYFIDNPDKMSDEKYIAFVQEYFIDRYGYSISIEGNIESFNPLGEPPILTTSGTKASTLRNFDKISSLSNVIIDEEGYIWINDYKMSGDIALDTESVLDRFVIESGTINDQEITNGNVYLGEDQISGTAESFGGIEMYDVNFNYRLNDNLITISNQKSFGGDQKEVGYININENVNMDLHGSNFNITNMANDYVGRITGTAINLPEGNYLKGGYLNFENGRPVNLELGSTAIIDGFQHSTQAVDLNLCYGEESCSGNYFKYGPDYFELNGEGFISTTRDDNDYISHRPSDNPELVDRLGLETFLKFEMQGGKIQVFQPKILSPGDKVSRVLVKSEGLFTISNDHSEISAEEDGRLYARHYHDGSMQIPTNMRINHLSDITVRDSRGKQLNVQKNVVRTWDINIGEYSVVDYTEEDINELLEEKQKIIEFIDLVDSAKDQNPKYATISRYLYDLLEGVDDKLVQGKEFYTPVFGEVITSSFAKGPTMKSSTFFSQPITNDKDYNYLIGRDQFGGAAVMISQTGIAEFDWIQRTQAASYAEGVNLYGDIPLEDNLYVMYMDSNEVRDQNAFLNILKSTSFRDYGGIRNLEALTHSFSTGAHFTEENYYGLSQELINTFDDDVIASFEGEEYDKFKEYYNNFLAASTGTRETGWTSIDRDDIERIRGNFADSGGSIIFRGCNVANFLHGHVPISAPIFNVLNPPGTERKITVGGAPAGTQAQKRFTLNDGREVWSFCEVDTSNGNCKRDKNKNIIEAQVSISNIRNRDVRYWPAKGYDGREARNQRKQLFPEIDSTSAYIRIVDIENGNTPNPTYTVEYTTSSGEVIQKSFSQAEADNIIYPIDNDLIESFNYESVDQEEIYDQQRNIIGYLNDLTDAQELEYGITLLNQLEQSNSNIPQPFLRPQLPSDDILNQMSESQVKSYMDILKHYYNGLSPYSKYNEEKDIYDDFERIEAAADQIVFNEIRERFDDSGILNLQTLSEEDQREILNNLDEEEINNIASNLNTYRDHIYNYGDYEEANRNELENIANIHYRLFIQNNIIILNRGNIQPPEDLSQLQIEEIFELHSENERLDRALGDNIANDEIINQRSSLEGIEVGIYLDGDEYLNQLNENYEETRDLINEEFANRFVVNNEVQRIQVPNLNELDNLNNEELENLNSRVNEFRRVIYNLERDGVISFHQSRDHIAWSYDYMGRIDDIRFNPARPSEFEDLPDIDINEIRGNTIPYPGGGNVLDD
ncbi:hypothetical protein ACFL1H_03410, partial [Nanoarchaeota archaeon]